MSTKRGNTFLIGVVGQNDLFQDFSISVRAISPPPIISLLPSGYSRDITIRTDAYSYFSVPVDSALEGKISITVEILPAKGALPNGGRDLTSVETLTQQLGRGLYTVDSLTASGLALEASDEDKPSLVIKDTLSRLSSSASFLSATIPPSIAKSEGLFPVAYFSDHSFYPTSHFYVWRASSLTGEPKAFIETSEWKYSNSNACYFSLIAATFPESDSSSRSLNCRITLASIQETDSLDEVWKLKLDVFQRVFEQVDGCAVSQQDRSRRMGAEDRSAERGDLQGLTYGEVDLFSFLKILRSSEARDNQVFVDLGCGVAKTLVASALSGIKFMRCIGIELLPGLCAEAQKALDRMKKLVQASNLSSSLQVPLMEIWEGDICDPALAAWTDADIIYVSSLCFPDHVIQKLMKLARSMRPGATLITLKSPDPTHLEYFDLVSASWFKMTWGRVLVYFLRRNDHRPASSDSSRISSSSSS